MGYNNYWKLKQAKNSDSFNSVKQLVSNVTNSLKLPSSWFNPLMELIGRESSWSTTAKNPTSTAYGLFQFLDTTRANYKKKYPQYDYMKSPYDQVALGIQYIKDRYGTPEKALAFWDKNNWY